MALILAVGALVATDLHLLDIHSATAASGDRHESSTTVVRATLKPVNVGGYNAAYEVTAPSFSVTVSTDRPTWVQAQSRATTTFAAELPAGATKQFQATGPLSLEIGAGGSTLVVHAGGEVIGTLRPTLAPWQATFTPT